VPLGLALAVAVPRLVPASPAPPRPAMAVTACWLAALSAAGLLAAAVMVRAARGGGP